MFVVWIPDRGVFLPGLQRPRWCAPGRAGWRCRRVLLAEDIQPRNVGAVPSVGVGQTFWAISPRSVWSVRSSVWVLRGGGAVQRGCARLQSWEACSWSMHGLQNQWSVSAHPQPRSGPRSGASSSPTISQQTLHGLPGPCGCGASPAGILRRGTGRGTIGLPYRCGRAFVQCAGVGGAEAVSQRLPCVSVCG